MRDGERMNIGVIFAGGVGTRMHSREKPKQFLELYNKPIIIHTIEHFQNNDEIDVIIVACIAEWIEYLDGLLIKYGLSKVVRIVPGGKTGQLSIYNGLCAAEEIAQTEKAIVLIHDGVRPLINSKLLSSNILDVKRYGSSITCSKVKETILEVYDDESIKTLPDRAHSRIAKAPQCFWLHEILSAHRAAISEGRYDFIDSCSLMNHYGYSLHMTEGPYENIKITTPDDFYTMRAILQVKEDAQIYGIDY